MKYSYAKKEDIPAGLEAFYKEADGIWVCQIEGVVPATQLDDANTRLNEFRSNNISLAAQVKEFEGRRFLTTEEQEEFDTIRAQIQDQKDKGLIDAGKIDELVASRTERLRTDYDNQIKGFQKQVETLTSSGNVWKDKLAGVLVEAEVSKILSESGFQPVQGALSDVVARARQTWQVTEKGELSALDASGNQLYGTDPTQPLSMSEWAASTAKAAPYLFMENSGSGGDGNNSGGSKGGDGTIRISRGDEAMKSRHIEDLATGKAVMVD